MAGNKEIIEAEVKLDGGLLPVPDLAEKHKVKVLQIATTDNDERPDDAALKTLRTLTPAIVGGPTSHVWLRVTGEQGLQGCGQYLLLLVVTHRQHCMPSGWSTWHLLLQLNISFFGWPSFIHSMHVPSPLSCCLKPSSLALQHTIAPCLMCEELDASRTPQPCTVLVSRLLPSASQAVVAYSFHTTDSSILLLAGRPWQWLRNLLLLP
jgi:hypothetical protein